MENLITKNITYTSIRESLGEDGDAIQKFIKDIKSPEIRDRIIDEAKEFFAKQFGVPKEDIWYGDLSCRYPECKNPFPYSHVIGTLDLGSVDFDMTKLVYCCDINSTGVISFPNLETINGVGNFNGTSFRKSAIRYFPKLKFAPVLYCSNSNLKELALERSCKVNLTCSKIEKIHLIEVEDLSVAFSPIKDITSLQKVVNFNCRNTNIEEVNPNLEITGKLYCEDSNNFETKIKTPKHNWWYTDNPNII